MHRGYRVMTVPPMLFQYRMMVIRTWVQCFLFVTYNPVPERELQEVISPRVNVFNIICS